MRRGSVKVDSHQSPSEKRERGREIESACVPRSTPGKVLHTVSRAHCTTEACDVDAPHHTRPASSVFVLLGEGGGQLSLDETEAGEHVVTRMR